MEQENIIIAVDGYSSTGKSTLARDLAHYFRFKYIDSGAMYRAVTLYLLRNGIYDPQNKSLDETRLGNDLPYINIDFHVDKASGLQTILLNGEEVEQLIRTMEISESVSQISRVKFIREKLVEKQRAFAEEGALVMDGRDIGTVVFPNADVKIFLTASPEVRAKRRFDELKQKGYEVTLDEVMDNVRQRDYMDEYREESPLKKASDAVMLDNSNLNRKEQLDEAIEIIRRYTQIFGKERS
ncbi:MAG: (d)CMP kinase [Bacteroidales bacterium]|nr:(d)CMP kinase [Bacteroidales bacterium]